MTAIPAASVESQAVKQGQQAEEGPAAPKSVEEAEVAGMKLY